jgi:glycosyltransferase involved in cell wall biosynthesis
MKFSLIIATLNRKKELDLLLKSLFYQIYKNFEIIIIDQNKDLIDDIVKKYKKLLKIKHIKVKFKGLSKSRNEGLKYANGDIVAFVDDDCEYLNDTLYKIKEKFKLFKDIDFISVKIIEKNSLKNVGINWPKEKKYINKYNMFYTTMSASLFIKAKVINIKFDERLGVGAQFGSAEESDFLLQLLKKGARGLYIPDIFIYHPLQQNIFNLKKEFLYAKGLGAFYKKYFKDYSKSLIFYKIFIRPIGGIVINIFNKNSLKYVVILIGRVDGFIKY